MSGHVCIFGDKLVLTCRWCDVSHEETVRDGRVELNRLGGWLCRPEGWLCPTCAEAAPALDRIVYVARGYDMYGRKV